MACFAWMQPGCPGIPVESACRNNLSPQTPMRTPVVNGRSLRTHSREVEGECLARTGPRRASEYRLRPWSTALRNYGFVKATSNSAKPSPIASFASFATFTKSTPSFPPFFFRLFNLLEDGPPLAPGVAERDVTYRLETEMEMCHGTSNER